MRRNKHVQSRLKGYKGREVTEDIMDNLKETGQLMDGSEKKTEINTKKKLKDRRTMNRENICQNTTARIEIAKLNEVRIVEHRNDMYQKQELIIRVEGESEMEQTTAYFERDFGFPFTNIENDYASYSK